MVGIFSRFSVGRNVHRRTQSALVRVFLFPSDEPFFRNPNPMIFIAFLGVDLIDQ